MAEAWSSTGRGIGERACSIGSARKARLDVDESSSRGRVSLPDRTSERAEMREDVRTPPRRGQYRSRVSQDARLKERLRACAVCRERKEAALDAGGPRRMLNEL